MGFSLSYQSICSTFCFLLSSQALFQVIYVIFSGLYLWDISVFPFVCLYMYIYIIYTIYNIHTYIASQLVSIDWISTSCLWWALRWCLPSKFNMSSILDSVVAPSNKEIYFLLSVGQFSEVLYKSFLFQLLPLATSFVAYIASIISLVTTIIPFPVCVRGHR